MAITFELNSFVGKFLNLWQTGRNASLKLESQAGKASVVLQLDLGYPLPPPHLPRHVSPAQHRRRARREAARCNAEEAAQNIDDEVCNPAPEEAADAILNDVNKETIEVTEQVAETNTDVALDIASAAEEAVQDFTEYCKFKGKNVHVGRIHKADGYSSIPQLDGEAGQFELQIIVHCWGKK